MFNSSKIITLIFVSLFLTLLASAQRNVIGMDRENLIRFGVKGGLNINKVDGTSYKEGFKYNYQFGGFMQINFSRRFGVQPEINFVQSEAEFNDDLSTAYDDLFFGGSQRNAKLNTLEIPVLLNVNVGQSKRVKLQVGPYYSNLLKQTVDSLKSNGDLYNKSSFGAMAGIWFQLPVVNFGARYKLGFTDINAVDDKQTWKDQAIQVFVGVTL